MNIKVNDRIQANKKFAPLFVANFVVYVIGMGLFPVLPIYAAEFGASRTVIGLYMALVYIAITAGTLSISWLPARLSRRAIFIIAGGLGIPALALLGQATALWQVVILTALVWFSGGVITSLTSIYTGLLAPKGERGRTFGLMFLTKPLAGIAGGLIVARLLAWQGYGLTLSVLALFWIALPIIGLFYLPAGQPTSQAKAAKTASNQSVTLGWPFHLLTLILLLAAVATYGSRLSLSLSMSAQGYSAAAIASIAVAGSLITLPIVPLIGSLSDRLGRQKFLLISSLTTAAGALMLVWADQVWQFQIAGGLLLASITVTGSVASALGTDLLSPQALTRGLPRLNAMGWIAGIVGFAGAGLVIDLFGESFLYYFSAGLALVSALLAAELRLQPAAKPALAPATPAAQPGLLASARVQARKSQQTLVAALLAGEARWQPALAAKLASVAHGARPATSQPAQPPGVPYQPPPCSEPF